MKYNYEPLLDNCKCITCIGCIRLEHEDFKRSI